VRLAACQGPAALLAALRQRGLAAGPDDEDDAVLVTVADAARDAPALLRGLLADGLDVYECCAVQVTLESVFLDLVREAGG
jgi:hypothetical protein